MRKFKLHTQDRSKSFDLNTASILATEPKGLGNSFSAAYKDSEKGKHLTNVTPSFEPIAFKIIFNADGSNGYANYKRLLLFLEWCGTLPFLLEYDDGITDKFCDVILKSHTKSEIGADGVFGETFTFERQSYWYEQLSVDFTLHKKEAVSAFPLSFPLAFSGVSFIASEKVTNHFYQAAPLIIRISGQISSNVEIYVKEAATNTVVSSLRLTRGKEDDESITIDPTTKKITIEGADGSVSNGYDLTDKTKQSFLYLPQGEYYIGANINSDDSGMIEISIKRYLFD